MQRNQGPSTLIADQLPSRLALSRSRRIMERRSELSRCAFSVFVFVMAGIAVEARTAMGGPMTVTYTWVSDTQPLDGTVSGSMTVLCSDVQTGSLEKNSVQELVFQVNITGGPSGGYVANEISEFLPGNDIPVDPRTGDPTDTGDGYNIILDNPALIKSSIQLNSNWFTINGETWLIEASGGRSWTASGHWEISSSTCPEPSSLVLAGIGAAAGLACCRWSRRRGKNRSQFIFPVKVN
jgi:hypothetical protein